jgi:hypothetical protein
LPEEIRGLVDHQAAVVGTEGFRNEMAGLARDIRAIPNRAPPRRAWLIACGATGVAAIAALVWVTQYPIVGQLTSVLVRTPQDNDQYSRMSDIVSGERRSPCAADRDGSKVQVFENGWLLIRFKTQTIYAIVRTEVNSKILWMSRPDDSHLIKASCTGVEDEQLLYGGFRYLYCNSTLPDLKMALGKPLALEIGALVQYQDWSGGLLAYGVPGSNAIGGRFTQLVGVFMNKDDFAKENELKMGRKVEFTFHNAAPHNVYCTALWYPANSDKPIPDDLRDRRDCDCKVDAKTYVKAHDKCLIFGFE